MCQSFLSSTSVETRRALDQVQTKAFDTKAKPAKVSPIDN